MRRAPLEALLLAACVVLAFTLYADRFALRIGTDLNGDTVSFIEGARHMRWFYDSGAREPLHPFIVKLLLVGGFDDERALRLASVVASMLGLVALHFCARELFGRALALVLTFAFATNPVVVAYAVSGMRDPLQAATGCLCVAVAVSQWGRRRPLHGALAFALAGAAAALSRAVSGVLLIVFLSAWIALCSDHKLGPSRATLARAALGFAGAIALWLPERFLRSTAIEAGYLRILYNLERTGVDGDASGPPLTLMQLLLADGRTPGDVALRCLHNLWLYFTDYVTFFFRGFELLWWLVPLGVLLSPWARRGVLALGLAGALAHILFWLNVKQVPGASGMEMRLVLPAYPLALLCAMTPLSLALRAVLTRLGPDAAARIAGLRPWLQPDDAPPPPPGS